MRGVEIHHQRRVVVACGRNSALIKHSPGATLIGMSGTVTKSSDDHGPVVVCRRDA
jgi:hypothetical protein